MNFASVRIVTNDTQRLVRFYEHVLGLTPTWLTDDFAELATPGCTLAIAHQRTIDLFGAGAAHAADNHTAIIEFRVADVDEDYERIKGAASTVIQEPTTLPWGNRSLLFRDPDGNLVNFFTPVTADALKRYDG